MLQFYELVNFTTKIGFCATFLINMIFINLTLTYIKHITGTYKKMLVMFAATCILFSGVEVIVQPFLHTFNGGLLYFSLVEPENFMFSAEFLTVFLWVNASCYVAQLVFIAIQFLFRYFLLIQHPFHKSFQGRLQVIWIFYFFGIALAYGSSMYYFLRPDDFSDGYLQEEIEQMYHRNIKDIPRVLAVPYENGEVRWNVITFLGSGCSMFGIQYLIIIHCALKMRKAMKTELQNFSTRNRKLELQFFKALTVQIILPTFLITFPCGFTLLVPLLDTKISCQTGLVFGLYSLYPPLDSIATMVIVKEYQGCWRSGLMLGVSATWRETFRVLERRFGSPWVSGNAENNRNNNTVHFYHANFCFIMLELLLLPVPLSHESWVHNLYYKLSVMLLQMLQFYELVNVSTKLGFLATFIINMIFINLTVSYAKYIPKTYKKLLVLFAVTCIIFAVIETSSQPFIHTFNGGLVYFSLVEMEIEKSLFSKQSLEVVLIVNASCYVAQMVFIAIQFLFRCFTLLQHPLQNTFKGFSQVIWIFYFFACGAIYGFSIYYFLKPDDFSDTYLQDEFRHVYHREIKDVVRVLAVAYEKGSVRWKVVTFFCTGAVLCGIQYTIIITCSLKMQKAMKTELQRLSTRNRKLEMQFFKALTAQIILPTFLITIPIGFVLLAPLLDAKISCQTGLVFALYSLYPPLDSVATMVIIKEYRGCVRRFWKDTMNVFGMAQTPQPNRRSVRETESSVL